MALVKSTANNAGIGMTSLRTRERMLVRLREQGIKDEVVLHAMGEIPRHIFVDDALSTRAYEDVALPIGFAQTISQPYIVARMTEILRNGKQLNKVLEIGTGCGYQTAVLSKVAKEVLSVERIRPLVMKARGHLRTLKCSNVKLDHADGSLGLNSYAPFDGIIVTAAASHVPVRPAVAEGRPIRRPSIASAMPPNHRLDDLINASQTPICTPGRLVGQPLAPRPEGKAPLRSGMALS